MTQQRQRADALAQVQTAAVALYGGLTSQQRTVFDFLAVTATGIDSNDPGLTAQPRRTAVRA